MFETEIKQYKELLQAFKGLHDTEFGKAYVLHKSALMQYERWSTILYEIRKEETKANKNPALKDRIDHILRTLNNIYTTCRMCWNRGEKDFNKH